MASWRAAKLGRWAHQQRQTHTIVRFPHPSRPFDDGARQEVRRTSGRKIIYHIPIV